VINQTPEIESAYLNINTVASDCETIKGWLLVKNYDDAISWIGFAIEQLESARAKIEWEKQKQERGEK
jgi:hypothetical protein